MVIFLLALVGVLLIVLNLHSINKDKDKGLFKENLSSSIESIDENQIKIGTLRVEIAESFLDLQTQMQNMKEEIDNQAQRIITLEGKRIDKIIDEPIVLNSIYEARAVSNNPEMDLKISEVQKLLDMGVSIDETAVKLCIGKGEVILIKNLYLK